MNASKNGRLYSAIAAVCFSLCALSEMKQFVPSFVKYGADVVSWQADIPIIVNILMAVLLFMGKKNIGFLIVIGVETLYYLYALYWLIQYLSTPTLDNDGSILYTLLVIVISGIATIVLFVLFLVNVVPAMAKYAGSTKILGFVPGVLFFVICIFKWYLDFIESNYESVMEFIQSRVWVNMLTRVSKGIGLLLTGIWLRETVVENAVKKTVNPYPIFNPRTVTSQPDYTSNEEDKLKVYKELLDTGVITQEEFEAKKKQILKL